MAIGKAKASKPIDPEGLNMLMLKKLVPAEVNFHTKFFKRSMATLDIPVLILKNRKSGLTTQAGEAR